MTLVQGGEDSYERYFDMTSSELFLCSLMQLTAESAGFSFITSRAACVCVTSSNT